MLLLRNAEDVLQKPHTVAYRLGVARVPYFRLPLGAHFHLTRQRPLHNRGAFCQCIMAY